MHPGIPSLVCTTTHSPLFDLICYLCLVVFVSRIDCRETVFLFLSLCSNMSEGTWEAVISEGLVPNIIKLITTREWKGTRSLLVTREGIEIVQANKDLLAQLIIRKTEFEEYIYNLSEDSIHVEIDNTKFVQILMCTSDDEQIKLTIAPPEQEIVIVAQKTDNREMRTSMSMPFSPMNFKYDLPKHEYDVEIVVPNFKSFLKRLSLYNSKIDIACKKNKIVAYCSKGSNHLCISELGEVTSEKEISSRRYDINLLQSVCFCLSEWDSPDLKKIESSAPATLRLSNTLPLTVEFLHIKALVAADGSSPVSAPKSFASLKKKSKAAKSESYSEEHRQCLAQLESSQKLKYSAWNK